LNQTIHGYLKQCFLLLQMMGFALNSKDAFYNSFGNH
jgi:hypothetical protein